MGNKNGFDVSQTRGTQLFEYEGDWLRVVYYRGGMSSDSFISGQVVFFEKADGQFWMGRTYNDMYMLEMDSPIYKVLTGLSFLSQERRMFELHENNGMFVDQQELPF